MVALQWRPVTGLQTSRPHCQGIQGDQGVQEQEQRALAGDQGVEE